MSPISPSHYSFTRYLAAKKSVDDRALNQYVWHKLAEALPQAPLRVLEIGAGIGTMVERLVERRLFASDVVYYAIDAQPANIEEAQRRLQSLPAKFTLHLETTDFFEFAMREEGQQAWDLLIAHAFLDLVDLSRGLDRLNALIRPGGLLYATLNFDGSTILEPVIDPAIDDQIIALYHRSMDERVVDSHPSGDSRTGRHLFQKLQKAGLDLLAAGSSDWVVYASNTGYAHDESYFLHFIIHTIHQALQGHPQLDQPLFEAWIAQRHAQIEAGTLVYIAHQLDFLAQRPPQLP